MNLLELSHRLTTEVRPRSSLGRLLLIGLGLLYSAASLSSVLVHVINIRYALDREDNLGNLQSAYVNQVNGLLYHIPFAVAAVVSAVIFLFPDRVGYGVSFLALLCSAVIYWRWDSWSVGMREAGDLFILSFPPQSPIGGNIFTRGLLILLCPLLLYESVVLIKVLLSWRKS